MMKSWNKNDLEGISQVTVEAVNAQAKTYSGRLQLAQNLMQIPGAIKTPQDYLMVVETGKVDHMMEDQVANQVNIKEENELMSQGGMAQAIITDDHKTHIIKHAEVMSSPGKRNDPKIVESFTRHMMEHLTLLQDPNMMPLYNILGFVPPPMPGQMGPGMPMPNGKMPGGNPENNMANQPNLPSPPKSPLTNEPYNVQ